MYNACTDVEYFECVMLLMRVQSMYNNVYSVNKFLLQSSLSFDAAMGRQSIETLLGSDVQ